MLICRLGRGGFWSDVGGCGRVMGAGGGGVEGDGMVMSGLGRAVVGPGARGIEFVVMAVYCFFFLFIC